MNAQTNIFREFLQLLYVYAPGGKTAKEAGRK